MLVRNGMALLARHHAKIVGRRHGAQGYESANLERRNATHYGVFFDRREISLRRVLFAGLDRFEVLGWGAHVTEQVVVPVKHRVSVGVGDLLLSVDWGRSPTQVRPL